MANFLAALDPDPRRRAHYIERITPRLSLSDGLRLNACAAGDLAVCWAAAPSAPVDCWADSSGCAVLWGDAIPGPSPERVVAAQVAERWGVRGVDPPCVFDGFYAALLYRPGPRLVLACDVLGLFPIYYWSGSGVLLAGSSPELFRHHPCFRPRLDPQALAGILLTAGPVGGRMLWQDVRRLQPAHALVMEDGGAPREICQYVLGATAEQADLPLSGQADLAAEAFESAVARQVPPRRPITLLLSGGLDSRMLAAVLDRQGRRPVAVTFGRRGDLDLECARPVAAALHLEQHVVPVYGDRMLAAAQRTATWEHLAGGFSALTTWTVLPEMRAFPSPVITAYLLDGILGGSLIAWAYDQDARRLSFPALFARINGYGLTPSLLTRLLRLDAGNDLVPDTVADVRRRYEAYRGRDSQRTYAMTMNHRIRFNAGGDPWRLSFAGWPVLPAADREVLETALRMPAAALAERRTQIELVSTRFPDLAALPLDRNSYDTRPLLPRPRALLAHAIRGRVARLRLRRRATERRYYYRTYDLNGQGWRTIRAAAEACRRRVADVFDPRVLDEILPSPETEVRFEDPMVQASGLKLLLGFLLWSKDHL